MLSFCLHAGLHEDNSKGTRCVGRDTRLLLFTILTHLKENSFYSNPTVPPLNPPPLSVRLKREFFLMHKHMPKMSEWCIDRWPTRVDVIWPAGEAERETIKEHFLCASPGSFSRYTEVVLKARDRTLQRGGGAKREGWGKGV